MFVVLAVAGIGAIGEYGLSLWTALHGIFMLTLGTIIAKKGQRITEKWQENLESAVKTEQTENKIL